jgi:hypothetical protein
MKGEFTDVNYYLTQVGTGTGIFPTKLITGCPADHDLCQIVTIVQQNAILVYKAARSKRYIYDTKT